MDKLYKLQFETKNLKKIEIQGEIDKNLLEKIINYNLFFYYLNKKEFKDKNKRYRETIYYDNILFFDGIISENIGSGRLYDILRPGTLLYEGAFINGLPGGNGTGYLIDLKISGSWLNGYILKNNLNLQLFYLVKVDGRQSTSTDCRLHFSSNPKAFHLRLIWTGFKTSF